MITTHNYSLLAYVSIRQSIAMYIILMNLFKQWKHSLTYSIYKIKHLVGSLKATTVQPFPCSLLASSPPLPCIIYFIYVYDIP